MKKIFSLFWLLRFAFRRNGRCALPVSCFEVVSYAVTVRSATGKDGNICGSESEAIVKVRVGKAEMHEVSNGDGPVHALDSALRKALLPHFPRLKSVDLKDYRVRILHDHEGTATSVVVSVSFLDSNNLTTFQIRETSTNVVDASFYAVVNGLSHAIAKEHAGRAADSIAG